MSSGMLYVLDADRNPVAVSSDDTEQLLLWVQFRLDPASSRVALTEVAPGVGVSTVFLGVNHGWRGPPVLFETMVFDDYSEGHDCWQYCTWAEAEAGHASVVAEIAARVRKRVKP